MILPDIVHTDSKRGLLALQSLFTFCEGTGSVLQLADKGGLGSKMMKRKLTV